MDELLLVPSQGKLGNNLHFPYMHIMFDSDHWQIYTLICAYIIMTELNTPLQARTEAMLMFYNWVPNIVHVSIITPPI